MTPDAQEEGKPSQEDLVDMIQQMPEDANRDDILAAFQKTPPRRSGRAPIFSPTNVRKCYNCQEPGHIAANCPKPRRERPAGQGRGTQPETRRCFKCGKVGHIAKDCKSPSTSAAAVTDGDVLFYTMSLTDSSDRARPRTARLGDYLEHAMKNNICNEKFGFKALHGARGNGRGGAEGG